MRDTIWPHDDESCGRDSRPYKEGELHTVSPARRGVKSTKYGGTAVPVWASAFWDCRFFGIFPETLCPWCVKNWWRFSQLAGNPKTRKSRSMGRRGGLIVSWVVPFYLAITPQRQSPFLDCSCDHLGRSTSDGKTSLLVRNSTAACCSTCANWLLLNHESGVPGKEESLLLGIFIGGGVYQN